MDYGHALLANENPGASRNNRFFGVHINDNYVSTDEDMTFASIYHISALEFLGDKCLLCHKKHQAKIFDIRAHKQL